MFEIVHNSGMGFRSSQSYAKIHAPSLQPVIASWVSGQCSHPIRSPLLGGPHVWGLMLCCCCPEILRNDFVFEWSKLWWDNGTGAEVLEPLLSCGFAPWDVFIDTTLYPWSPGPCPHSTSPPPPHSHCHPSSGWWPAHTSRAKNVFHPLPLSPVGTCTGLGLYLMPSLVVQDSERLILVGTTIMPSLDPGTKPCCCNEQLESLGCGPSALGWGKHLWEVETDFPKPDQGPTIYF